MARPLFSGEYVAFSPFDRVALAQLVQRVSRDGCRAAEIGSWLGNGSTQVFLEELATVSGSALLCVDHWEGNTNVKRHQDIVTEFDVLGTFRSNVRAAGSRIKFQALISASEDAARLIADGSFDLVFVDADHGYDAVKRDIAAWLPKVRRGGILCGHDCEARVTDENEARLRDSAQRDTISGEGTPFPEIHPGSILAVSEAFNNRAELWAERPVEIADGRTGRSTIWFHRAF
jgi:predicted O-methyltransferase YrrM